jgi:hypothetical protein
VSGEVVEKEEQVVVGSWLDLSSTQHSARSGLVSGKPWQTLALPFPSLVGGGVILKDRKEVP